MSITVLNYMDQALVDRIHSQAAKRAETAKQTTSDDFATVLADSTKAIENNQNTISTNTAVSDTSTVSTGQTAASSASSYTSNELDSFRRCSQYLWCFFYYTKINCKSRIRI